MPVLIGWSAVTGTVSWSAFILFMVIFFWTPPHYWPLSLRYKDDYATAHVPMLPVVERFVVVARQIVAYSWAMVLTSLALIPVQSMGWVYTVAAVVSGGLFLAEAHRLLVAGPGRRRRGRPASDAPLPLLDHLPDDPLRRRRARPDLAPPPSRPS